MKQRLILFSALLIVSLLLGVASADDEDLGVNITHNGTDDFFDPADVVNITATFNGTISEANISIIDNSNVTIVANETMGNTTANGVENCSFSYIYIIPGNISEKGPLDVEVYGFGNSTYAHQYASDFLKYNSTVDPNPGNDSNITETDSNINVTYNKTNVIPGDIVNVMVDFNESVANASILITNKTGSPLVNALMDPLDVDDNSFTYNYAIPLDIIRGNLSVDINASDANGTMLLDGKPLADPNAFVFDPHGYLDIFVTHNGTGTLRPGDMIRILANFSMPVDHANISIGDSLPGASNANLVGADFVTDYPMTEIDDDTFAYDFDIPEDISGPLDIDVSGFDDDGNLLGDESFPDEFDVGDPYISVVTPSSEFAAKKCVDFNFTAYDTYGQSGGQLTYTFYLNGVQKSSGVITSGQYKQFEYDLSDGKHTWEIKTRDSYGNTHTTGSRSLYVDTKCPSVILTSPQDCYKELIGATEFNFTCNDDLATQYSDLDLSYQLYIDGQLAENFSDYGYYGDEFSGSAKSGESIVKELELDDGAHNWSVYVEDGAGNKVTSEVRDFYVSLDGFVVNLESPSGGYVPAKPTFTFTVQEQNGEGAGLPFNYKLLIDGKEVDASCNQKDEDLACCDDDASCDMGDFVLGEDNYSVTASVKDGTNKNWTVIITDCTSGKTYQPDTHSFSVDSVAPACVANLNVEDALGQTFWQYVNDYPGLMVSWNASTDTDLADMPYEVYISSSKPSCIEDMQLVNTTGLETHTDGSQTPNQKLENSSVTSLCIEAIDGKDLIYGKDYWVAVIARDNASNYNSKFSMCGPVRTYEDMTLTLEDGWNLKSVPKALVDDCSDDVFGKDSTVLYWDGSCWQFPDDIEPCKGYWVYTAEPLMTNVKFKGMSSNSSSPYAPSSLELCAGWNMIGHTSSYYAPWSTTLSSLNDFEALGDYRFSNLMTYDPGEGWGGIIPSVSDLMGNESTMQYLSSADPRPVGALQTDFCMVPGQGYWIFMKDKGTYASIENSYKPELMSDYSGMEGM
jgi:hypothetical protein